MEHLVTDHDIHCTLLGTGTSTGVPVIGCDCETCTSTDSRDNRTRCSCLIEVKGLHILIDAGPDFRLQALRENIRRIDAVLFTHAHFDHVCGVDDLRPFLFYNRNAIPCYADPGTTATLGSMFSYIFKDASYPGVPNLTLQQVSEGFTIFGRYPDNAQRSIQVIPIRASHGLLPILGYRVGDIAYLTDVSAIPESSFEILQGTEILFLDALRKEPHPTHFSFDDALEAAVRIKPRKTYFIHMTHTVKHEREEADLPTDVRLGYDGLRVTGKYTDPTV